jgi:hypothetical protein
MEGAFVGSVWKATLCVTGYPGPILELP